MKEIKVKLYQYDELDEKAKEKARQWWIAGDFDFSWDNIKEDAEQVQLKLSGMDRGSMTGDFIQSARVTSEAVLTNHGANTDTFILAHAFEKAWEALSDDADTEREGLEAEFLRDLLEEYRIMYEKDIEYQASEEAISEAMEANEYDFLIDGTRFQPRA